VRLQRPLPHDLTAEANVLGSMMLSTQAARVGVSLPSEVFYRPANELIHAIMIDLFKAGEPIDAMTVAAAIMQRNAAQQCGGITYVHDLISTVISPTIIDAAMKIVKDRAQLRGGVPSLPTWHATSPDPRGRKQPHNRC
jgi:replicative DNA helicase